MWSSVVERRLKNFYGIVGGVLRLNRSIQPVCEAAEALTRHECRLLRVEFDPRARLPIGIVELMLDRLHPRLEPVVLIIYVSGQLSPKRPSQVDRVLAALKKWAARVAGQKILLLAAYKGVTRGAFRALKRNGVGVALTRRDVEKVLATIFSKRAEALAEALARAQRTRIRTLTALLAVVLDTIARKLGATPRLGPDAERVVVQAYRLLEKYSPGLGPPPGLAYKPL